VHLLYFWRGDNYRRDLDHGVGFHLNQANPLLHQIDLGESLWAFTRTTKGRYALAAELVISAKTMNPRGFRYGPYRVWGDLERSRYFSIDGQPNVSTLIRSLDVHARADVLGQSFQGKAAIRALGDAGHAHLLVYAKVLPLERFACGVDGALDHGGYLLVVLSMKLRASEVSTLKASRPAGDLFERRTVKLLDSWLAQGLAESCPISTMIWPGSWDRSKVSSLRYWPRTKPPFAPGSLEPPPPVPDSPLPESPFPDGKPATPPAGMRAEVGASWTASDTIEPIPLPEPGVRPSSDACTAIGDQAAHAADRTGFERRVRGADRVRPRIAGSGAHQRLVARQRVAGLHRYLERIRPGELHRHRACNTIGTSPQFTPTHQFGRNRRHADMPQGPVAHILWLRE
jgi:hypothetical protein